MSCICPLSSVCLSPTLRDYSSSIFFFSLMGQFSRVPNPTFFPPEAIAECAPAKASSFRLTHLLPPMGLLTVLPNVSPPHFLLQSRIASLSSALPSLSFSFSPSHREAPCWDPLSFLAPSLSFSKPFFRMKDPFNCPASNAFSSFYSPFPLCLFSHPSFPRHTP